MKRWMGITRTRLSRRVWGHAVLAVVCSAGMLSVGAPVHAAPMYSARLLDIAPQEEGNGSTRARGINNVGQVVGMADGGSVAVWNNGGASPGRRLAPPPDDPERNNRSLQAGAINASGMVVAGASSRVGGGVVWRDPNASGTWVTGFDVAQGVNDAGVVVGRGFEEYSTRPARWVDGVFSLLQVLPDSYYGQTRAINNLGVIVGTRIAQETDPGQTDWTRLGEIVTLWEGGVPRSLDIPGFAVDINDRGQVVGTLRAPPDGGYGAQGFLWSPDGLSYLNPLAGVAQISALNDDGLVVGWSDVDPGGLDIATLWEDGQAWDLNTLVAPNQLGADWVLRQAYDINDQGWIVGDAVNTRTGDVRGFVLTPQDVQAVPEPPVLLLMLAALGLATFAARGRGSQAG